MIKKLMGAFLVLGLAACNTGPSTAELKAQIPQCCASMLDDKAAVSDCCKASIADPAHKSECCQKTEAILKQLPDCCKKADCCGGGNK